MMTTVARIFLFFFNLLTVPSVLSTASVALLRALCALCALCAIIFGNVYKYKSLINCWDLPWGWLSWVAASIPNYQIQDRV
jgi:hypothetical protein